MKLSKVVFTGFILLTFSIQGISQNIEQKDFSKNILFVLDGSGSMNEKWSGETKWDIAISTLSKLIDSFQSSNQKFKIGIRLLGHQHPRNAYRCDDTWLELPFSSRHTYDGVLSVLNRFTPQGHTPLAYTLSQCQYDFKDDDKALNTIILITDGLENCDGNPCEVSQELKQNNIIINPYIIGLGIDSLQSRELECIGEYIDARDKVVFKKVVENIIKEVSQRTTLKVSFLKSDSSLVTNYVPYSLIERNSGKAFYDFIYTDKSRSRLDTILVNPQFQYNLMIHSRPPIIIDTFKIQNGLHHEWKVNLPLGSIAVSKPNKAYTHQYHVKSKNKAHSYFFNDYYSYHFVAYKNYSISHITHPNSNVDSLMIKESKTILHKFPVRGKLKLKIEGDAKVTIFNMNNQKLKEFSTPSIHTMELNEGKYYAIFKRNNQKSNRTKMYRFSIGNNLETKLLLK